MTLAAGIGFVVGAVFGLAMMAIICAGARR